MDEGFVRDGFVVVIGFYMKLVYWIWNKEYYVFDEVIKNDLKSLLGGKFELFEEILFDNLGFSNRRWKWLGGDCNDCNGWDKDCGDRGGYKFRVCILFSCRRWN